MKTFGIVVLGLFGCVILGLCVFSMVILGILDGEAKARFGIQAQEDKREAYYSKMKQIIVSKTQITKASSAQQKELVDSFIKGRSATFIKIIQEQNPDVLFDRNQYASLANTIEAERQGFFREQTHLISRVQEYDNMYGSVISGFVLATAGRQKYPHPVIISSDEAKAVRESGVEKEEKLDL